MSVSLDHILTLTGRLDDASGFDAPRERFRRFLSDYVRESSTAHQLIDQCQHAPGDQHRRALHDLVVVLGQFLGFRTAFGPPAWVPAGLQVDGTWHSRTPDPTTIDVRLAPASAAEFDQQLQSAAANAAAITDAPARHRELYVVTPLSMNRSRLQDALAATRGAIPIGVVTLHTLVTLADLVDAGRMRHDEIVKLLESDLGADFIVGLLEPKTPAPKTSEVFSTDLAAKTSEVDQAKSVEKTSEVLPGFWLAPVVPDYATSPEEFLEVVVSQRHAFGITAVEPSTAEPKKDDWLCFYIAGKGVVGHARIASFVGQTGTVREPRRLRQILILQDLELTLSTPVEPDAEAQLRLHTARGPAQRAQILMSVSRESFETMTQGRARVRAAAARTLSA